MLLTLFQPQTYDADLLPAPDFTLPTPCAYSLLASGFTLLALFWPLYLHCRLSSGLWLYTVDSSGLWLYTADSLLASGFTLLTLFWPLVLYC